MREGQKGKHTCKEKERERERERERDEGMEGIELVKEMENKNKKE